MQRTRLRLDAEAAGERASEASPTAAVTASAMSLECDVRENNVIASARPRGAA